MPYVNIVLTAFAYPAWRNVAIISDEEELAAKVRAFERNQIMGYNVQIAVA